MDSSPSESMPQKTKSRRLLGYAVKNGASDLHLTVGCPPALRIDGEIRFLPADPLTMEDMEEFLREMMKPAQLEAFENRGDFDLAFGVPGLGRFRVNALKQRGTPGLVMRHVKNKILSFEELHLPPAMEKSPTFPVGWC